MNCPHYALHNYTHTQLSVYTHDDMTICQKYKECQTSIVIGSSVAYMSVVARLLIATIEITSNLSKNVLKIINSYITIDATKTFSFWKVLIAQIKVASFILKLIDTVKICNLNINSYLEKSILKNLSVGITVLSSFSKTYIQPKLLIAYMTVSSSFDLFRLKVLIAYLNTSAYSNKFLTKVLVALIKIKVYSYKRFIDIFFNGKNTGGVSIKGTDGLFGITMKGTNGISGTSIKGTDGESGVSIKGTDGESGIKQR